MARKIEVKFLDEIEQSKESKIRSKPKTRTSKKKRTQKAKPNFYFSTLLHFWRRVHSVVIASASLLFIFVVAGVIYVYFSGGNSQPKLDLSKSETNYRTPIEPSKPSLAAPESAAIVMLDSSVKPGEMATTAVQTLPGSICSASLTAKTAKAKAKALKLPKALADSFGTADWQWLIPKSEKSGHKDISVTCEFHKKTAVVDGGFEVKS